jgi:hypothetical protein
MAVLVTFLDEIRKYVDAIPTRKNILEMTVQVGRL